MKAVTDHKKKKKKDSPHRSRLENTCERILAQRGTFTVPTVRLPVEEAVVPGEVGDDAQVVGLLASHIAGVQQRRDAQLGLCDLKGLQVRGRE